MKKITYLLAPLMVLPCMASCGKSVVHNVSILEGSSRGLRFTDMENKEISPDASYKVNDGKDFVFKATALQDNSGSETPYILAKEGIFVQIGEDFYTDFTFEPIAWEGDHDDSHVTTAKITIPGTMVKKDIKIGGLEWKTGYYVYYLPYLYGVSYVPAATGIEDHGGFGYCKMEQQLQITFSVVGDYDLPRNANVVLESDDKEARNPTNLEYNEKTGTLTVTAGEIEGYLIIAAKAYGYSLVDELDWGTIKIISKSGYAPYLFDYGETKTIYVNNKPHDVEIIGFNHDTIHGSEEKAGITFQFKTLFSDSNGNASKVKWNQDSQGESHDNYNYYSSKVNELVGTVMSAISDSDLKADGMIEEVDKQVGIYSTKSNGWNVDTFQTKIFILSQYETNKTLAEKANKEGTTYAYYAAAEKDSDLYNLRKLCDANGVYQSYWFRSPAKNTGGKRALAVNKEGKVDSDGIKCRSNSYAIAPAFCI